MAYTPKTWKDYPSTDTMVTASDLNRIEQGISTAQSTAESKFDAPSNIGTTGQVIKLDASGDPIWDNETKPTIDTALSDTSENAVQNKVIKGAIDAKLDAPAASGTTGQVIKLNASGKPEWADDEGKSFKSYATKSEFDADYASGNVPASTSIYIDAEDVGSDACLHISDVASISDSVTDGKVAKTSELKAVKDSVPVHHSKKVILGDISSDSYVRVKIFDITNQKNVTAYARSEYLVLTVIKTPTQFDLVARNTDDSIQLIDAEAYVEWFE